MQTDACLEMVVSPSKHAGCYQKCFSSQKNNFGAFSNLRFGRVLKVSLEIVSHPGTAIPRSGLAPIAMTACLAAYG
jgi:hypothetical protein